MKKSEKKPGSKDDPKKTRRSFASETLFLAVLIAFAAGFLTGTVFTVYRTTSLPAVTGAPGAAAPAGGPDPHMAELEQRTRENPADVAAWIEMGNHHFDGGNIPAAVAAYEKALELDASNADVWTDLGVMYRRSDRPRDAIDAFDRALAARPGHPTAQFNKGVVLMHDLEDQAGALAVWQRLAETRPDFQTPGGQSLAEMLARMQGPGAPGGGKPSE